MIKLKTMRWIDAYVGKLLLVLAFPFRKFLVHKKASSNKILFILLSEMGSIIQARESFYLAKMQNKECYFVTFEENAELFEIIGIPKAALFLIKRTHLLALTKSIIRFFSWSFGHRFHYCVDLELFSRFSSLLTLISFSKVRSGYKNKHQEGLFRGDVYNVPQSYNPHLHISENFKSLTWASLKNIPYIKIDQQLLKNGNEPKKIGFDKTCVPSSALFSKMIKQKLNGQKTLVINPDSGPDLRIRNYPIDKMRSIVQKILLSRDDLEIIVVGTKFHIEYNADLLATIEDIRITNLTGQLNLKELFELFAVADVLLTSDSGPSHFAEYCGLKSVVFFGPETPILYGPRHNSINLYSGISCSPCLTAYNNRKSECTNAVCLGEISAEKVYRSILKQLDSY